MIGHLFGHLQLVFEHLDRPVPVVDGLQRRAEIPEGPNFSGGIVELGRDGQVHFVKLLGVDEVADLEVDVAEAGRCLGLTHPVVGFPAGLLEVGRAMSTTCFIDVISN